MTVGELSQKMTSDELTEWMAFFQLEPWGTEVEDIRSAIIATVIANANRDPKKQRAFKIEDFMPKWGRSGGETQTVEEQMRVLENWRACFESGVNTDGQR